MRRSLVALAAAALAVAGCAAPVGTTSTTTSTAPPIIGSLPFDPAALGAVRAVVTYADGTTEEICLLLADDAEERGQGLMFVTDPALGGYDGMVFAFDRASTGGFWMRNTVLPLTITFVAADGTPVGTLEMEPCPDEEPSCPTYGPDAPYRWAIEVPTARAGEVPLGTAVRIEVTDRACSA